MMASRLEVQILRVYSLTLILIIRNLGVTCNCGPSSDFDIFIIPVVTIMNNNILGLEAAPVLRPAYITGFIDGEG
jgi:hypothetical protein